MTKSAFNMALRVFNELSHLAPIIREGAILDAEITAKALKGAFGEAATLSHVGGVANVTIKELKMPLTSLVEKVLAEDVTVLKSLEKEMAPAAFKELSTALTAAKGMSTLSEESFHMFSGIRSSLSDVADSLRGLKTENKMTQDMFEAVLKESAQNSAKSAELLKTYEKIGSEIAAATKSGRVYKISGKLFTYAVLPTAAGIGVWQYLKNYAKKNSGCYIFAKNSSMKYRVNDLSKGMGTEVVLCDDCHVTEETQASADYIKFKKIDQLCNPGLCKLESLKAPFCDPNLYTMSCIELDEADALADITSNITGGIGPAITNFAYNFTKKMAPFLVVAGLGYLGFTYIVTRYPAGPMAMMSSTPYYTRLDDEPKRKKSTAGYPGPLKKRHPQNN